MFSNILGTLTSSLPKNFIFASYVPVLVFGFLNALLLCATNGEFYHYVAASLAKPISWLTAIVFAASVVAAYILSTVNDGLRELLEGKNLILPLDLLLRRRQRALRDTYDTELKNALDVVKNLDKVKEEKWKTELREAAKAGTKAHPNRTSGWNGPVRPYKVRHFERRVRSDRPFSVQDVQDAVDAMVLVSKDYDKEKDPALFAAHGQLLGAISDARDSAEGRLNRNSTRRRVCFGRIVEPTRMGNVVSAIDDYTLSRYGIDLDTFWSRCQSIVQKNDEKAYAALVDAKTQLDFLITSFWLTLASTLLWFIVYAFVGTSWWMFVVIAAIGLAIFIVFHRLAVINYLSYGALIRAAVDLNRFTVLKSLHFPLPGGIREERFLWTAVRDISWHGENVVDISYEHPTA